MRGAIAHAPVLMQVTGLTKRYRDQTALADISFAVNAGEVLGLIGPNGAGKTTLLEAIAGLIPADDGRVLWRGAPLPLRQRRERMFYLPDGLRPWDEQYVAPVVEFFAAAYGRPTSITAQAIGAGGRGPGRRKPVREALAEYLARRQATRTLPSFTGAFSSGRADTADRHEEILFRKLAPHNSRPAARKSRANRRRA